MYGQFFVIFALLFTGYFFRKINVISDEMNQGLNRFIVCFAFPCFIFHKIIGIDMNAEIVSEFFVALGISVALFLIYGIYAWGYGKIRRFPRESAGSAELMMIFSNNAFMGFPIAYLFFGDIGLFFMLANNIAMNAVAFSYGIFVLRRNDTESGFSAKTLLKCLLNPNIIAFALGIFVYMVGLKIPETVDSYLMYISGVCTPMTMIFIGSTLVGSSILKIIRNPIAIETVLNKNFIIPILTCLLLAFLPIAAMIKAILVFAACFPSATVAALLVETERKDVELACGILVVSTSVSIVSLPIAVKLINMLVL